MKQRGFTLLELLIALAIVGALLAILLGGLRVGLAAWRQGEERAEVHQHLRSLTELLRQSLGAAFPYRQSIPEVGLAPVLFFGEPDAVLFATLAPPFPVSSPAPFAAVRITSGTAERPGLMIQQRVLPNFDPLNGVEPVVADPGVTEVSFRYLRPGGDWEESWDGFMEESIPGAVEVQLTATVRGRSVTLPPITIPILVRTP